MNYTEHKSAGITHMSVPMKRSADRSVIVVSPTDETPIQVFLVKSGWNHGYPTYHVITEYGDYEQSDYKFMSAQEAAEYLGVPLDDIHETRSFILTREYVQSLPNDGELGKKVRQETISPF